MFVLLLAKKEFLFTLRVKICNFVYRSKNRSLTENLQLHGSFLRPVECNVAGNASKDFSIVRPIQATRCILHGQ